MQTAMASDTGIKTDEIILKFCTFWLSGRLFGVDILKVKEINRELDFTPIFHAPKEVKGYVNIRGQIHLVLDLRLLLGFESRELDNSSCMVIFKQSVAEPFGVLVDKVGDVVEVEESSIEERSNTEETITRDAEGLTDVNNLIEGVCKLDDNLLVILSAKNLLSTIAAEQS